MMIESEDIILWWLEKLLTSFGWFLMEYSLKKITTSLDVTPTILPPHKNEIA